VSCVVIGVYCGGPHGQFRQHFHHPRKNCHVNCLGTGRSHGIFAWVVEMLAKLSMRATAAHANYHATHAQQNSVYTFRSHFGSSVATEPAFLWPHFKNTRLAVVLCVLDCRSSSGGTTCLDIRVLPFDPHGVRTAGIIAPSWIELLLHPAVLLALVLAFKLGFSVSSSTCPCARRDTASDWSRETRHRAPGHYGRSLAEDSGG
jgi:hypothetical protein